MKELVLSKGKTTIVDEEDFYKFSKYKWYCNHYGYAVRTQRINGKKVMFWLHREIMNCPKGMEVDHKNNNPLDNRKSNLRICNRNDNCRNIRKPRHNTSGYKGVSFDKRRNKWRAYLNKDNKQISLGSFETKEEAALAYNKKAIEIFGEFAKINEID